MAGVRPGIGCYELEYVEAMACRWAMQQALEKGFETIIMEGDCLGLISKLQNVQLRSLDLLSMIF